MKDQIKLALAVIVFSILALMLFVFVITITFHYLGKSDSMTKSGTEFCKQYDMKYQATGGYNREFWCYDSHVSNRIIETEEGWRFVEK